MNLNNSWIFLFFLNSIKNDSKSKKVKLFAAVAKTLQKRKLLPIDQKMQFLLPLLQKNKVF